MRQLLRYICFACNLNKALQACCVFYCYEVSRRVKKWCLRNFGRQNTAVHHFDRNVPFPFVLNKLERWHSVSRYFSFCCQIFVLYLPHFCLSYVTGVTICLYRVVKLELTPWNVSRATHSVCCYTSSKTEAHIHCGKFMVSVTKTIWSCLEAFPSAVSCIVCPPVLLRHMRTVRIPWIGFHVGGIGSFSAIQLWKDYERSKSILYWGFY